MLETMKRILTMAGKYRHKVTIGIIISLLHSFFSAMDLFAILYVLCLVMFRARTSGRIFGRVVPKILRRKISVFAIKEPPFIR